MKDSDKETIAAAFRASELANRATRRSAILRSEAALEHEPLTEFDKKIDVAAKESLRRQQEALEEATGLAEARRKLALAQELALWWAKTLIAISLVSAVLSLGTSLWRFL